jgi:class 3 adenylate cyclase/tetratricopeptide (TPR) repeat protein
MAGCPSCGASNPERFRFCGTCGAALPETGAAERSQVRKVVTVLFVDVTGSTELGEQVDPEAMRRAMGRYFALTRGIIERHGGTVEKFIGDAVMAVFGVPQVHEDDALRAVRAAAEIRFSLEAMNKALRSEQGIEIKVRIGLNTGEVVAGEGEDVDTLVTGDPVNTAARLEQTASPGEILMGEATQRLVRGLTTAEAVDGIRLKGKQAPITAYRLLEVASPTTAAARRLEGPMVGRRHELNQLTGVLARVNRERRCHLFTIVGGAGVGKSRLVREFIASFGDEATVLRGRCLPYGDGITYWPVMEVVREAAAVEPTDLADEAREKVTALVADQPDQERIAQSVAAAIGLSRESAGTEEIAWGVRKLFQGLARPRPLVVIFDDIQWAEPALLDLVEHVVEWTDDAPVMMLCVARPDLLDDRPTWSGGLLNATTVLLEPLPATESEQLIENLLGSPVLEGPLGRRIVETAEGNPLFVEEMIGMLVDAGVLVESDGSWSLVGDVDRVEVPPTIQALLAARLDRLPQHERALAQRGAVIGRTFEQQAVTELSPEADRSQIVAHLRGLVRHQVIGPYQADDVYRFRHLLIRDAAYEALPKEERAVLHERFADWLEATSADRLVEHEEILGYHLEQAHGYRISLGQRDEQVSRLAARAGGWLAAAGHRADQRRDARAARHLLTRAIGLLPEGDPHYWSARLDLGNTLADAAELDASIEMLSSIVEAGDRVPGDVLAEARLFLEWGKHDRKRLSLPEARRIIGSMIRPLVRAGNHRVAARAWSMLAGIYQDNLDVRRAEAAYGRGAREARISGDAEYEADMLFGLVGLGSRSRMPVSEAIEIAQRALATPSVSRAQRSHGNEQLAYLYALHGRFDEARALIAGAMQDLTELGLEEGAGGSMVTLGLIESFAENYAGAEEQFRASMAIGEAAGSTWWIGFMAGRLTHVLMLQGKDDEALEMAERAAGDEWTDMFTNGARARILARRGETSKAVELARRMVAEAEGAGFAEYPAIFGPALEDLAEVLRADGKTDEARAILARDLEMQRAKENLAGVAKIERALAALSPSTTARSPA